MFYLWPKEILTISEYRFFRFSHFQMMEFIEKWWKNTLFDRAAQLFNIVCGRSAQWPLPSSADPFAFFYLLTSIAFTAHWRPLSDIIWLHKKVCLVTPLKVTWHISFYVLQINLRKKKKNQTLPLSNLLTIDFVCVYVSVPLAPRSDLLFWDLQIIPSDIRVLSESGCTCWCPACMSGSRFCTRLQILRVE